VRLAVTPFRLFLLAVAGQLLFGIVLALPGTLFGLPAWTGGLGFDVAAQARLVVVFFAGQFVFTAMAGSLVDRVGCQRVLSLGSLLMAIAFGRLAGAAVASDATVPAILLAAGGASINAASSTLVSVTYSDAGFVAGVAVGPLAPTIVSVAGDRYPRQMGAAIGLLLSIAQIGGMLLPWLTGRATIAYGYRAGLVVPALAAFGVAAGTVLAWQTRARRVVVVAEAPAK
jgi:MFS family permease